MRTFEQTFNGMLAGNDQMRVRAKALPPGSTWQALLGDDPLVEFDRFLLNVTVAAEPQWPADLMPVAPLYGIAGGWQQEFAASRSVVCTDAGVVTEKAGPDYRADLGAANAKITALEAVLAKGSGSGGNLAYKAAVDALKVALAADAG